METAREALAHVQAKIHAPKDQRNDFGKYNYRNAEGIIAAFKAVAPEGAALTLTDRIEVVGDRVFLIATAAFHWSGEIITCEGAAMHAMQKKGMDDAQITGACSSYARKYALCGLLLIDDSTADPDSRDNRDQNRTVTQPQPAPEPPFDAKGAADSIAADLNKAITADELAHAWKASAQVLARLKAQAPRAFAMIEKAKDARKAALSGNPDETPEGEFQYQ